MNNYLKCVIFLLSLSISMVKANDELMLSAFLTGYPNNMQYGTIYSDHAKLCICGLNTEILGSVGQHQEMYRLAQAGWNWTESYSRKKFQNYSNTSINNSFLGSAMWYSPLDASFSTLVLPAKMMKAVIEAWVEIMGNAEIEATVGDCVPYISYFAPTWYEAFQKTAKDKEERAELASSHHADKFWDYEEKGKVKMSYPDDFTGIKQNWLKGAEGKTSPKWIDVKKYPRLNSIVCEVGGKRKNDQGDEVDKTGNIILATGLGEYKLFFKTGKPLTFENGFEAANKIEQFSEKHPKNKSMIISNRAFLWNQDIESLDLSDSAAVIENLVMPNTFEHTICTNLLNPKSLGDFFRVTTEEWDKIWDYYKWNCPMIAYRGPLGYNIPDEEEGMKFIKRVPMYDKDHANLFPMEPGSERIVMGMKDIFIDPNSVEYKKSDDYDGILEGAKNGDKENEEEMKNEAEQSQQTPSPESEIQDQDKPTDEEVKKAIEDAQNGGDSNPTGDEEGDQSDNESQDTESNPSHISESFELPEPVIIKIKTCEERRVEIEKMFQDKVPTNEKEAAMMINLFMAHPHVHSCREMAKFQFNYNDDGGSVVNIDPEAVVLHWRVKRVNPFKYDPKQKDPKKVVFEVIFWNHFYEDQKDALYYIPAREVVNEWDKFPGILLDFEGFVVDRMGEVLTVPNVYAKFKQAMTTKFIEYNTGFKIGDTSSGPEDLPGNSSAYQYQMTFDDPHENYILHFFRIDSMNERGYFDFIFQCWRIGEKYVMVKINGTQFNYSVLINIYSNEEKLQQIWNGIYKNIDEKYLGPSGVVSLLQIKQLVYNKMKMLATTKYKFGYEESQIPLPGDEYEDPIGGHQNMIQSEHTNFLFNYLAADVDITVIVRGFVHFRENISVLNLYFSTDMFESEYIIPLDNETVFDGYIDDIFNECYMHMYMLLKQISIVESEDTTEEELDAEQKMGRYSMKKLLLTLVHMLQDRVVYGCVDKITLPKTEMAYNDDGTPKPITNLNQMDDSFANQRVYKWTVTPPDNTGELLLRRSNHLFQNLAVSRCEPDDTMNPVLLHLYPTRMDDRNGYALTINSPSLDGNKDYKTTYHFVKYQDYAHMRVFEKFINKILNQMFDLRLPEEEKEGGSDE